MDLKSTQWTSGPLCLNTNPLILSHMAESLLKLEDVWKTYTMGQIKVPALQGISLEIQKSDFVAIIGASGSGKSTMMNLIGCLDIPTKGKIMLKGKDITKLKESDLATLRGKTIGFIFQQYNLIQNMNSFDNVLLPLEFLEVGENIAAKRVRELLNTVGLNDKLSSLPSQLSGGQQQRVSIARALIADPEIILADEPTGNLDSSTGRAIMELFTKLWKKQGKTLIMVTHDLGLAKYAQTIIELKDGKIVGGKK
jgi:putative ABC transport system ATP-binding protein